MAKNLKTVQGDPIRVTKLSFLKHQNHLQRNPLGCEQFSAGCAAPATVAFYRKMTSDGYEPDKLMMALPPLQVDLRHDIQSRFGTKSKEACARLRRQVLALAETKQTVK